MASGVGVALSKTPASMTQLKRIAFIGNSLPRRCGIATFTTDLHSAIRASSPQANSCIVAMNDDGRVYDYPADVKFQIDNDVVADYERAATFLNTQKFDVVCLQHEFGIFGGEAGAHVLALLTRLEMPIVTTLHTVLSRPSPIQHDVLRRIIDLSSSVVVMAQKARELLQVVQPRVAVREVRARVVAVDVLVEGVRDRFELRSLKVGEQRHAGEAF